MLVLRKKKNTYKYSIINIFVKLKKKFVKQTENVIETCKIKMYNFVKKQ